MYIIILLFLGALSMLFQIFIVLKIVNTIDLNSYTWEIIGVVNGINLFILGQILLFT